MDENNLEQIQRVVDYIEENLSQSITLQNIADEADFSMFYFHRMFRHTVGETITEYIRKRRLTLASWELLSNEKSILEIAFEFNYESQEAFTRAFKRMYGTTPGKYRKNGNSVILLNRTKLSIDNLKHLNGGLSMEPKFKNLESFKVVGMRYFGENKNNEIPELWDEFIRRSNEVKNRRNNFTSYGICQALPEMTESDSFYYIAGVEVDEMKDIPTGMISIVVPAARYVVFTHRGPTSSLDKTYEYIYGTWFPKSKYKPLGTIDFEMYNEKFTNKEDSSMYIYIPVE